MVVSNGLFYSTLAFSLIAALLFLNLVYMDSIRNEGSEKIIELRALAFSEYTRSVSLDISRALDVSCKRALLSASNDVISTGTPLDDASYRMRELVLNETIRGTTPEIMRGQSLGSWLNASMEKGRAKGFAVNITPVLSVSQPDAFTVECAVTASLEASDPAINARFSKTVSAASRVSLEGYPDPIFSLKTNGIAVRSIMPAGKSISGIQAVEEAVSGGYYMASTRGASFFDRLEGSYIYTGRNPGTRNSSGLESFVNLEDLSMQGIDVQSNQSIIDYYYFNSTEILGFTPANASLPWLRLDLGAMSDYGLSPS